MFHPSAPTSLSLANSFTLGYVTAPSSANGFTPTTASSVDPLSITVTFLLRLGLGCRSYNGPKQTAFSPGKITHFLCPPTSSTLWNYEKDIGLRQLRVPRPFHKAYLRFTPSLGGKFDDGFLQIPHWLTFTGLSLLGQIL